MDTQGLDGEARPIAVSFLGEKEPASLDGVSKGIRVSWIFGVFCEDPVWPDGV